ncbi:lysozyme [Aureimonas phyllosphaerae]|uniref:lysozyme n=1 Tax=Aureimonas phyllosphaerae TaxID=1166078 RepID=UPI003A5B935D
MPIGKIAASKRGKAAVFGAVLAAAAGGWAAYVATQPSVTPAVVRTAIAKGITPPAVQLAVDRLIKPWEGLVLTSHWDPYAKIWDICYGETRINGKPVTAGMRFTKAECEQMLNRRVISDYFLPLVDRVKGYNDAPISVQASLLSGAYNFGVGAAVGSTAARHVSAGRYAQACAAQTAFSKAGGQVVKGLVKRREMGDAQRLGEAETCLSGLK